MRTLHGSRTPKLGTALSQFQKDLVPMAYGLVREVLSAELHRRAGASPPSVRAERTARSRARGGRSAPNQPVPLPDAAAPSPPTTPAAAPSSPLPSCPTSAPDAGHPFAGHLDGDSRDETLQSTTR
jgi:hypothetical protein